MRRGESKADLSPYTSRQHEYVYLYSYSYSLVQVRGIEPMARLSAPRRPSLSWMFLPSLSLSRTALESIARDCSVAAAKLWSGLRSALGDPPPSPIKPALSDESTYGKWIEYWDEEKKVAAVESYSPMIKHCRERPSLFS